MCVAGKLQELGNEAMDCSDLDFVIRITGYSR